MSKYTYGNRGFKGFRPASPSNPHNSPASIIPHHATAAVIEPSEGPQLDWITLKVPYYTYVLALTLLDLNNRRKPRRSTITSSEIRSWLKLKKSNWHGLEKVIKSALKYGILSQATRKGKVLKGLYDVNYNGARYVASLIPMNIGVEVGKDKGLMPKRQINNYYKLSFGAFKIALEVINEFKALQGGTSLYTSDFWVNGNEEVNNTCNTCNTANTDRSPLQLKHLRRGLVVIGVDIFPIIVLGGGKIYFIPIGVGGGAKSRFPCLVYPNGKRLCGSPRLIQELMERYSGNPPEPIVFGGYDSKLVVDIPAKGIHPYDLAPDQAPRLEVGVQVYGSALQSCLSRFHIEISTGHNLPKELKGWPSLILLPSKKTAKSISYDPDALYSDVLFCIDSLIGTRHTIMNGLGKLKGTVMHQALAIAREITPPEAIDPPVDIYISYKQKVKVKGKRQWRNIKGSDNRSLKTLEAFISELKGRLSLEVAKSIRVIVPLPEISNLKELLTLGYIYGYHNDNKDPPNAIRIELRPYYDVTNRYNKHGLMATLLGTLGLIGQPLIEAWHALSNLIHHHHNKK